MKIYFLLRENKESGPYSLAELKNYKLKALDLIWIEGESIIWKYPSEIRELQSLTPQVDVTPATLINSRKEKQIAYFRWNIMDMGFKTTNINNIQMPDAFVTDVPGGFEYLVMAERFRRMPDYKASERILEEVFNRPVEEELIAIPATPFKVLGAPQVIDTAEISAEISPDCLEMPFRYKSKRVENQRKVKKRARGFGHGLAGWAAIIAAAFMHFKI